MNWEKVKLGELCNMNSGGTPRRGTVGYYGDEIPWAKISDIEDAIGGEIFTTEEYITQDGLKSIGNRVFPKGSLLLAMYGSVGKTAIAGVDLSTNQAILGIRIIDSTRLNIKYLKYWLGSIKEQLLNRAVGGTLQNISLGIVKELHIPLPPLQIQEQIAETLDKADALRKKDQNLFSKYDELAHSLFHKMFGDPIKNEMCWTKTVLKSVTSKIGSGSTPTGGKVAYKESGISLVRSMNIYDFAFKWKDLAYIDDAQAAKLDGVKVKSKDVLFNITGASVCRCSIVPDEVLPARVNQHVAILRANQAILNPVFLNHLLVSNSIKKNLLKVGSSGGAVMEAITKEKLENYEIILPPIELQNQFEKTISIVFNGKKSMIQTFEKSNQLFDSLIQKIFNSELVA